MTASELGSGQATPATERLTLVSLDSHVAPQLAQYRPYVDAEYLERFDDFKSQAEDLLGVEGSASAPFMPLEFDATRRYWRDIEAGYNLPGIYSDVDVRLSSMDADGIAAEVMYHGGFNRLPIPFHSPDLKGIYGVDIPSTTAEHELRWAGIRAYNRWLADWTSAAPQRLIGLAFLPVWNVEAAVEEVHTAAKLGFRGANLPVPRAGLETYNSPGYEPLWAACVETGMTLHSHSGAAGLPEITPSPGFFAVVMTESGYVARRHLWQLIFGGVFHRHPELKLALTEQAGRWIGYTLELLDSVYMCTQMHRESPSIRQLLPQLPSEYFHENVFIGASFTSRAEVNEALSLDYWENMMWGRDFPHPEGTWPFTRESIRNSFAGCAPEHVTAMLGGNAITFLGLDARALAYTASRVGPTVDEVLQPIDAVPDGSYLSHGFRMVGAFA